MEKEIIIKNTIEKLLGNNSRLKTFQKETVFNIVDKFDKMNRVLLADEVGLGKTEIAKGVIASMAEKHYKSSASVFKVAYICPNLNIVSQNFPKLKIFETSFKNEKLNKDLRKIKVNPDAGVHTRIRDILIELSDGKFIEDIIDSKALDSKKTYRELYQGSKGLSSEWSKTQNKPVAKVYENYGKLEGFKELLDVLKNYDSAYLDVLENIEKKARNDLKDKHGTNILYQINKEFINFLASGGISTLDGSRLSMQHLYSAEAKKRDDNNVMSLEALTPQTSFIITNEGTVEERALIAATLDYCKSKYEKQDNTSFKRLIRTYGKASKNSFEEAYDLYKGRLISIEFDKSWISYEMCSIAEKKLKNDKDNLDDIVKKIRKGFILENLKMLKYDLVIMDEFQNFSELIDVENQKDEVSIIANRFFQDKETMVLLLSATPFKINYVDLNTADEENVQKEDDSFEDFNKVIKFLYNGDNKCFKSWEKKWGKVKIQPQDIYDIRKMKEKKEKCEKLLFDQIGLVRTERIYALEKPKDMFDVQEKALIPNFYYHLKSKKLLNILRTNKKIKLTYPISYSKTTPYALSFSSGYKILEDNNNDLLVDNYNKMSEAEKEDYSDLFLKLKTCKLINGKNILSQSEKCHHPAYSEYKTDLFNEENYEYPTYYMLWIPPSNIANKKLSGAFEGREGFSKELIFSRHKMTPKALTFLLCKDVAENIRKNRKLEKTNEDDVKDLVKDMVDKVIPQEFTETNISVKNYFEKLFLSEEANYIISAVKQNLLIDYTEKVRLYCNDGCFLEMLKEYFDLLKAEYDSVDIRIAKNFDSINKLKLSNVNLLLYNSEKKELQKHRKQAENKFAMGLFSEKEGIDSSNRLVEIQKGFKSPFWPFVFTSTSIGTEGIDLHWYSRNVVHWTLPNRPIDIEQREGRVLRYNCHAVRLNNSFQHPSLDELWLESEMYPNFLNFNYKGYKIIRKTYFEKFSVEEKNYKFYKKIVSLYRMLIGQADLSLFDLELEDEKISELQKCFICLSPYYQNRISKQEED